MSAIVSTAAAQVAVKPKPVAPSKQRPSLTAASREARQRAAAILEVLAGVRTPADAAQALGVTVPRYYLWEERALHGLVQACEVQPTGRRGNVEAQRRRLERECQRWQRECGRQQALLRAAQRSIGLAAPATVPAKDAAGKRRVRRPTARALRAAARLRSSDASVVATPVSTATPPPS
jgi:hypothetical protein